MAELNAGQEALAHIDRALADRPKRDGKTLKSAVQILATFRDHFMGRHRSEGGTRWRSELERVNAVLSIVIAAEFPIGEVPWGELIKAREWLNEIVCNRSGYGEIA